MSTKRTCLRAIPWLLLVVFLPAMVAGQSPVWMPTNGPYGGPVKALLRDLEGNLFAGTNRGIYRSMDDAASWTLISHLMVRQAAFIVDSSGAILAGQGLSGGREGGVWRSTDAGESWTPIALVGHKINSLASTSNGDVFVGTPDGVFKLGESDSSWRAYYSRSTRRLKGVAYSPSGAAFAVGDNGAILRSTDNGASWEQQQSGTTEDLSGVCFATAETGIVVGHNGTMLRTTNGGGLWTSVSAVDSGDLYAVTFVGPATGVAVGLYGTVLRTTDAGATWKTQTTGVFPHLDGVAFADADTGLAATYYGTVLRTTDGGITWALCSTPSSVPLQAVAFADRNTAIVVGNLGKIFRTTDRGTTWTEQESGTTHSLRGVSFAGAAEGVVVGMEGTMLLTTDAGATWISISSGTTMRLADVDFRGNACGIAVGYKTEVTEGGTFRLAKEAGGESTPHGLSGKEVTNLLCSTKHGLIATAKDWSVYRGSTTDPNWVLIGTTSSAPYTLVEDTSGTLYVGLEVQGVERSTDGGSTWEPTGLTEPHTVTSLASLNTGQIYAGAYPLDPTFAGGAYRSTDAGSTWRSLGLEDWGIDAVLAMDQSKIFLGSQRGVFVSRTGGNSWEVASEGIAAVEPQALLCVDQSTLFAGTNAGLFRSTDDGDSWHESGGGIFPHWVWALACDHEGNLFAGNTVFTNGGGIYKSIDGGESWRCTTRDLIHFNYIAILAIVCTKSNALVASVGDADYRIIRSGDGGETWATVTTPRSVSAIASDPAGDLYGPAWGYGVLRSTDDGLTWDYANSGLHSLSLCCIATRDSGEVFAGGRGGVSRSTDSGDSWAHITASLGDILAEAVAVDIDGDIIISTWPSGVFRSTDDGLTWSQDSVWTPFGYFNAFSGTGERLFAADTIGYIFRYARAATAEETPDITLPTVFHLEQNFPNPFNPSTVIRYQIPVASDVKLVVYDLLGRDVATLVSGRVSAGRYEVQFSTSALTSGIYLYRLTAGGCAQTKKMLLVR